MALDFDRGQNEALVFCTKSPYSFHSPSRSWKAINLQPACALYWLLPASSSPSTLSFWARAHPLHLAGILHEGLPHLDWLARVKESTSIRDCLTGGLSLTPSESLGGGDFGTGTWAPRCFSFYDNSASSHRLKTLSATTKVLDTGAKIFQWGKDSLFKIKWSWENWISTWKKKR